MLIRRSAKMLAENVDCAWPGFKKRIWLSEKQLLNLRCHRITMVQATESRKGLNLPFTRRANFCRPTCWRVLRESEMRPVLVIIEQVGRHQPFEMPLIQDDHVVQQVAAATSHPALRNTVLPRTAKGRASWLASHVPHSRKHLGSVRLLVGPCFSQLLYNPKCSGISRHIEMQDLPPVVADDEKAVQNTKRERWDGEEIHCSNGLAMVSEERQPSLPSPYLADSGDPRPIQTKPGSMPVHDGSRSDQDERLGPPGPERSQRNPEQLVQGRQSTARLLRVQSQQLPTESQVLEDEVLPGTENADQPAEEMSERHAGRRGHRGHSCPTRKCFF